MPVDAFRTEGTPGEPAPAIAPLNVPTDSTSDQGPQLFAIPKEVDDKSIVQVVVSTNDRRPEINRPASTTIVASQLDSGTVDFTAVGVYFYAWTVTDGGTEWQVSSVDTHATETNRYGSVVEVVPWYAAATGASSPQEQTFADLSATDDGTFAHGEVILVEESEFGPAQRWMFELNGVEGGYEIANNSVGYLNLVGDRLFEWPLTADGGVEPAPLNFRQANIGAGGLGDTDRPYGYEQFHLRRHADSTAQLSTDLLYDGQPWVIAADDFGTWLVERRGNDEYTVVGELGANGGGTSVAALPTSLTNLGNWHGQNLQNAVTNGVMVGAGTGSAGTGAPHGAFTGAMRVRRIGDYVEQQFHTSNAPGTVVGEIFWRESYNAGATWTAWIGQ